MKEYNVGLDFHEGVSQGHMVFSRNNLAQVIEGVLVMEQGAFKNERFSESRQLHEDPWNGVLVV